MRNLAGICVLGFLFIAAIVSGRAGNGAGLYVPEVGKSVKPRMDLVAAEQRDGYECRLIEFSVAEHERINAYLLVPDSASRSARCPGLVLLHDHGARFDIGKEKLVRPVESVLPERSKDHIARSARQWVDVNFDGVYLADSLASLGYVVLVADALYWGDRSSADAHRWSELTYGDLGDASSLSDRLLGNRAVKDTLKVLKQRVYEGQRTIYDDLLEKNVIWAEKMLRDDVASVRLLSGLPFVDKNNIGAFGFSMGAHRCWMLAAFCDELKCGVALSWMTVLDRDAEMKASDYSMAVMPMREQMDFGDIGFFLAPKPMLFLSGESDHLFPTDKTIEAFEKLQGHYDDAGSDALRTEFFPDGHHCGKDVQKTIIEYFDSQLR